MTIELIEFLLGIYFVGISTSAVLTFSTPKTYTKSIDLFKLAFGAVLVLLALQHGIRFI